MDTNVKIVSNILLHEIFFLIPFCVHSQMLSVSSYEVTYAGQLIE